MSHHSRENIDDIHLAASLAAALHSDGHVPAGVTIDVSDGVVTLEGQVATAHEREMAETVVRSFSNLVRVVNAITLRHSDSAT